MSNSRSSAAINSMGLKLLQNVCEVQIPDGGFAISSASIGIALAMLAGGAADVGCDKVCDMLGVDAVEGLDQVFLGLAAYSDTTSAANAIFAEKDVEIREIYIQFLQRFSIHINQEFPRLVDGLNTINAWIANNTNNMIQNMLQPSMISNAHLILINTLAYKGIWKDKFNPASTIRNYPFHLNDSTTSKVDMMFRRREEILVHRTTNYMAVRLPYQAAQPAAVTSFIAYLPHEGKSVQDILSQMPVQPHLANFMPRTFDNFGFPKMEMSSQKNILPLLSKLGYQLPTEFPNLATGSNLVQAILHRTVISLDEQGTRAAACTTKECSEIAKGNTVSWLNQAMPNRKLGQHNKEGSHLSPAMQDSTALRPASVPQPAPNTLPAHSRGKFIEYEAELLSYKTTSNRGGISCGGHWFYTIANTSRNKQMSVSSAHT
ncbi:hypothetical protein FQN57_002402 [Myotisia sp. PD_48]|nr:hypothetical protein FQN57_002402 [Myotisia sp. PD_48]